MENINEDIIEYSKIPTILKRYSFETKMNMAQHFSRLIMNYSGAIKYDNKEFAFFPWEIETFVLFAITTEEWQIKKINCKNVIKILNSIRNYIPPKLKKHSDSKEFLDWFLITTGQTQFQSQQNYMFNFYRYNFYFTFNNENIDMADLFLKKFKFNHYDYLIMAQIFWLIMMSQKPSVDLVNMFYNEYKEYINYLSINREQYIKLVDSYSNGIEDYIYCLRPSYTYPFIEYDDFFYLPTPHLLFQSVTSSMMYRLTNKNDTLRQIIGKEVYEAYLFKIMLESRQFEEVVKEQEYWIGKNRFRTPDVMIKSNDYFILLDSKSYVPKSSLRLLDENAFNNDVERIAKAVAQVYKHVSQRFGRDYYPFETKIPSLEKEKIYGIVVLEEEGYLPYEAIYSSAAKKLKVQENSNEFKHLIENIIVLQIYDIERILFTNHSLLTVLLNRKKNNVLYCDLNLEYNLELDNINLFRKKFLNDVSNKACETVYQRYTHTKYTKLTQRKQS